MLDANIRKYDLHCHSDQSDGILSPEALVSRAKANEVDVLALTDHDTINGLARARAQAELEGVELINGIEFSCQWLGRNIHIVALGFDTEQTDLVQAVQHQSDLRSERAVEIGRRLDKLGLQSSYDKAYALSGGASVGRPHFARVLVDEGKVNSVDQAFRKYLGVGKTGDVKQVWPEVTEMAELVQKIGGVAVLAHPLKYSLTRTKLIQLIEAFAESGGKGIEVVSGIQKSQETRDMARVAEKYELYGSCGSDFHAPNMHWAELGKMSDMPDNVVPVWSAL